MKKLILLSILGFGFLQSNPQSRDLNINITTLNDVVKGKWILTNSDPANASPFQEFTIKGPGFGEVGKLRAMRKVEQIMSKIILGNGDISFSDADGDRVNFRITELTKTSIRMSNGKVTLYFSKD